MHVASPPQLKVSPGGTRRVIRAISLKYTKASGKTVQTKRMLGLPRLESCTDAPPKRRARADQNMSTKLADAKLKLVLSREDADTCRAAAQAAGEAVAGMDRTIRHAHMEATRLMHATHEELKQLRLGMKRARYHRKEAARAKAQVALLTHSLKECETELQAERLLHAEARADLSVASAGVAQLDSARGTRRELQTECARVKRVNRSLQAQLSRALAHSAEEPERTRSAVHAALSDASALHHIEMSESLEKLQEELEARWSGKVALVQKKASDAAAELKARLKVYAPAKAYKTGVEEQSAAALKQARYRTREHLKRMLSGTELDVKMLASVLDELNIDPEDDDSSSVLCSLMFGTRLGWQHLLAFIRYHPEFGIQHTWAKVWTGRLAVKMKVDLGLSEQQVDAVRHLISHKYSREDNATVKRAWLVNPWNESDIVYFPCPVVSRTVWIQDWQQLKVRVGFGLSSNGEVALKQFVVALREQIFADRHLMPPLDSFTPDNPVRQTLSPDACGFFSFKLLHFLLRNSSMLSTVHRNAEKRGTTVLVAHSGDHHADLMKAAVDTGFADAVDAVNDAGRVEVDGIWVPVEIFFSGDKPAVEGMRGSGQCCAWCFCSSSMLHVIPFTLDQLPADYDAWLAGLSKIKISNEKIAACRYPVRPCAYACACASFSHSHTSPSPPSPSQVSTDAASVLAHAPKKGETLPSRCLAKGCKCHLRLPFADVAAMVARQKEKQQAAKDADTEKKRAALGRERSAFAKLHGNQHELCRPIFRTANLNRVVVEVLHMMYLNVPKSFVKWGALKHLGEEMRSRLQDWFKRAIGVTIDFRPKDSGRQRENKWCSGDQWAKIIKGTPNNPRGLLGLASYIVDLLVEQQCIELEVDSSDHARIAKASSLRAQWAAFRPTGQSAQAVTKQLTSLLGKESANTVVTCLNGFDALHELTRAINDPWVSEYDSVERKTRAHLAAIAAIKLSVQWEAASGGNHRSWYMHIMLYILPRQIAELGDLWRFSSGPLEARGARLQRAVRTNGIFRPSVVSDPNKKSKGDYSGNTLTHAATMVEAGKYLLEENPELDSRRQHRLDYYGRSSKARKAQIDVDAEPELFASPLLEWCKVKCEPV